MLKLPKIKHLSVGCSRHFAEIKSTVASPLSDKIKKLKENLNVKQNFVIERLNEREIIRVRGSEAADFLQGLITNDIKHLKTGSAHPGSMYAMFLNKAGRVLYDTIIYATPEVSTYLLECDTRISNELRRHLRTYRVRRKIDIDTVDNEYRPWVIFNPKSTDVNAVEVRLSSDAAELQICHDPRTHHLGVRVLAQPEMKLEDIANITEKLGMASLEISNAQNNYRTHLYRVGVGEGITDMPPGKAFPLESNCDFLHGVSFHKGCYIGQELTARVHHTGVVRKRLMPLHLLSPKTTTLSTVHSLAGANLGRVMGISGERALALLRVEKVLAAQNGDLLVNENPVFVEKPIWWPYELPNRLELQKLETFKTV